MVKRVPTWAVLSALCACGPTTRSAAELQPLCGSTEPVQLLELEDGLPLLVIENVGVFGERRVLEVYRRDEIWESAAESHERWSVGPCGESPLRLPADGGLMRFEEVWPDRLFQCDMETGEIMTLDPSGLRPDNAVFQTDHCWAKPTAAGLLTVLPDDADSGSLVLQPWPEDPWTMSAESVVLIDSVALRTPPRDHGRLWAATDEEAVARSPDGELVRVGLPNGTPEVLATGIRRFDASEHLRYLVWQSAEPTNDDPDWIEGAIHLVDRELDTSTEIAETSLDYLTSGAFVGSNPPVLELRLESLTGPSRVYTLPSLDPIELPGDVRLLDYRHFAAGLIADFDGRFELLDPESLSLEPLYEGKGGIGWLPPGTEAITMLAGLPCCIPWEQDLREEAELLYIPLRGEALTLAKRATHGHAIMADRRVITTLDLDADLVGPLVVVYPDSLEEREIDGDVGAGTIELDDDDESVVVYGVAEPEHLSVWMARVAK